MRVREGLSNITANLGHNNYQNPQEYKVGKVYAVILSPESVPQKVWEDNGKWDGIGIILYQEYREAHEIPLRELTDARLEGLATALPLSPNQKYFPLPGEIVMLVDLPSAPSPITNKTKETYYISPVNTWNNPQFNGLFIESNKEVLYDSFEQNKELIGLRVFEGDYILEGRFGNSIRFGSTNKEGKIDQSPWSTNPEELKNNPITLITNQHNNKANDSVLYVEDINKDGSSIYLTSHQIIPLDIGNIELSNITLPVAPKNYTGPQIILNADRVVVSSKDDEILLFGKKGIEAYSSGPIYLQSNQIGLTLQDNNMFLGPYNSRVGNLEPLVLGNTLKSFLITFISALSGFNSTISNTVSQPEGTILMTLNAAASALQPKLEELSRLLDKDNYLVSQKIYTI